MNGQLVTLRVKSAQGKDHHVTGSILSVTDTTVTLGVTTYNAWACTEQVKQVTIQRAKVRRASREVWTT